MITAATNILALAVANADALKDFGLTDQQTQTLEKAIGQYQATKDLPRGAAVQRSVNGKALVLLFRQTKVLLKTKLDKMMLPIKLTDANEYAKYRGCRSVVGNSTTVTQLKGKVTSIDHPKGIKNVLVTLTGATTQQSTSAIGIFSFKGIDLGIYSIKLTATGYNDLIINDIEVKQGQLNTQKIVMEKTI